MTITKNREASRERFHEGLAEADGPPGTPRDGVVVPHFDNGLIHLHLYTGIPQIKSATTRAEEKLLTVASQVSPSPQENLKALRQSFSAPEGRGYGRMK